MKKRKLWWIVLVFGVVVTGLGFHASAGAEETVRRPIADFIDAQGGDNDGYDFFPYNYVGWLSTVDAPQIRLGVVDYAAIPIRPLPRR